MYKEAVRVQHEENKPNSNKFAYTFARQKRTFSNGERKVMREFAESMLETSKKSDCGFFSWKLGSYISLYVMQMMFEGKDCLFGKDSVIVFGSSS
jgi:hypothetical protein